MPYESRILVREMPKGIKNSKICLANGVQIWKSDTSMTWNTFVESILYYFQIWKSDTSIIYNTSVENYLFVNFEIFLKLQCIELVNRHQSHKAYFGFLDRILNLPPILAKLYNYYDKHYRVKFHIHNSAHSLQWEHSRQIIILVQKAEICFVRLVSID